MAHVQVFPSDESLYEHPNEVCKYRIQWSGILALSLSLSPYLRFKKGLFARAAIAMRI